MLYDIRESFIKRYLFKDKTMSMNVAALFSGGKDSVFSVYIAEQYGWNVTHLVTILPENKESWMFHSVNINLTDKLAEAIEIPLIKRNTKGEKESELEDLKKILSSDIDVSASIYSPLAICSSLSRMSLINLNSSKSSFLFIFLNNISSP